MLTLNPLWVLLLVRLVIGIPVNGNHSDITTIQANYISEATYGQLFQFVSLCSVSYCQSKNLLSAGPFPGSCPLAFCSSNSGIEVLKVFKPAAEEVGASGYLAIDHSAQKIYVVFRGSQSEIDWMTDFNFTPTTYTPYVVQMGLSNDWSCGGSCQTHRGFYQAVGFFMDQVFNDSLNLLRKNPSYQLVITGHSLGGALALFAGIEFQVLGFTPLVVTFGQPKISATYTFVDEIDSLFNKARTYPQFIRSAYMSQGYYRVDHVGDKIVGLPPTYIHGGTLLHIDKRSLPHYASDVKIGSFKSHDANLKEEDDIQMDKAKWREQFLKEHSEYFRKVTGCHD